MQRPQFLSLLCWYQTANAGRPRPVTHSTPIQVATLRLRPGQSGRGDGPGAAGGGGGRGLGEAGRA
jgi:hypothetical protein